MAVTSAFWIWLSMFAGGARPRAATSSSTADVRNPSAAALSLPRCSLSHHQHHRTKRTVAGKQGVVSSWSHAREIRQQQQQQPTRG